MGYGFGVAVKGYELYYIGFRAGEYMHYRAHVPCLQTFFVYVICQYDSVVLSECHVVTSSGKR